MTRQRTIHATYTEERLYPAAPERVFAAWADPSIKARWFAPGALRHELDFRVGGEETLQAAHDGEVLHFRSTYHDIVDTDRIVYASTLFHDSRLATVSLTTVELHHDDPGTRLVLCEQGTFLDGLEDPASRRQGTSDWLDALGDLVSGDGSR